MFGIQDLGSSKSSSAHVKHKQQGVLYVMMNHNSVYQVDSLRESAVKHQQRWRYNIWIFSCAQAAFLRHVSGISTK